MHEADIREDQYRDAESWCLKNDIKVYPVTTSSTYEIRGARNKKITLPLVRLVLQINNAKHTGKELYRQDEEMTNKMRDIYWHYYNKSGS